MCVRCLAVCRRKVRAWQLGVALFAFGNVMNFGSFGAVPSATQRMPRIGQGPAEIWNVRRCCAAFAAQSLLAALGSVQFLANVAFGRLILKEPVPPRHPILLPFPILLSFSAHSFPIFP